MLKYTPKTNRTLAELSNRTEQQSSNSNYPPPIPKNLASRPSNILIPKHTSKDLSFEPILTPKTSRTAYDGSKTPNSSFRRSKNVTPDLERFRKDGTSRTPIKSKPTDSVDAPSENLKELTSTLKTDRNDRSQKLLRGQNSKEFPSHPEQKGFLRQTVSNATVWQLRHLATSNSIKPLSDVRLEKNKSSYQGTPFRKKIQSQYIQPAAIDKFEKEYESKINSTKHSRKNSNTPIEVSSPGLEFLAYKAGLPPHPTSTNLRKNSQEKLTHSTQLPRKQKMMSQTDPVGGYFNLGLLRQSSGYTARASSDLKIEDFQLGSCKGEGRFGKVFPAVHRKSGFLVAIKQIKKQDVRLMLQQFVQQLKINMYCNHPNIVRMFGFFSDRIHFYIMMQYMQQGSLYKHIKLHKKLTEEQASLKLYEICDAVNYLHSQDVLHRDIKPQNIVISNGVSKLCDFGWATYSKERRNTYCGTLDYVCPEILEGDSYDSLVDIWAIGVLAYEMLTGKAPFYHISRKQTMKSIMNCDFSFPAEMSISAKMFIKKALQKNPGQRFTIDSLLGDRFLAAHSNC